MNSERVVGGIEALRDQLGDDLLIGASTVRTAKDVERAVDAGATLLVTPCLDLPSVEAARRRDILLLPGVFTASEAQATFVAGCETVYHVELSGAPRGTDVIYDRADSAVTHLKREDVDWDRLPDTRVLHLTGITPALRSGCRAASISSSAARATPKRFTVLQVRPRVF